MTKFKAKFTIKKSQINAKFAVNKPVIKAKFCVDVKPKVGDGILTIVQDGTELGKFTANQFEDKTITIPKSVSDFEHLEGSPYDNTLLNQALSSKADFSDLRALANEVSDLDDEVTVIDEALGHVESTVASLQDDVEELGNDIGRVEGKVDEAINTESQHYNELTGDINDLAGVVEDVQEVANSALQPNDNISELNNNLGFQTETQVNTAITSYHDTSKQDTLVSGTNIKTINNESILGSGNISITGGVWGQITGTLNNQTDLKNALDAKSTVTFVDWSIPS